MKLSFEPIKKFFVYRLKTYIVFGEDPSFDWQRVLFIFLLLTIIGSSISGFIFFSQKDYKFSKDEIDAINSTSSVVIKKLNFVKQQYDVKEETHKKLIEEPIIVPDPSL